MITQNMSLMCLLRFSFTKLLTHFCSQTPDYVMSFDGHYRYIKNDPKIPFIEMSNSVAGPIRTNRPFIKTPVEWENKVVKVEPAWYNKVLPIEDKTIYSMLDSYRYVYLRYLVAESKRIQQEKNRHLPFISLIGTRTQMIY